MTKNMKELYTAYLNDIRTRSMFYKLMGQRAISQMDEKEIHFRYHPEDNNIATIVKHISGNLVSRWSDFLTSDGEKIWRNRESEFQDDIRSLENLFALWEHGWKCYLKAIDDLNGDDLLKHTYIRNEKLLVFEAIQRQVQHNAYHVGQLVYLAKSIKGKSWISLSIPKGGSKKFNKKMGVI